LGAANAIPLNISKHTTAQMFLTTSSLIVLIGN
jgi:hypothetical protein